MIMSETAAISPPRWVLIANDGALFRGPGRGNPIEVWTPRTGWKAFTDAGLPRGIEWGEVISKREGTELMSQLAGESLLARSSPSDPIK